MEVLYHISKLPSETITNAIIHTSNKIHNIEIVKHDNKNKLIICDISDLKIL